MSKYAPLGKHLTGLKTGEWRCSFADLEILLGFALPDSSRRYAAWWANHGSDGRHASAWLDQGWRAEEVDLGGERLVFRRGAAPCAGYETACRLGMSWVELGAIGIGADGMLVFPSVPKTAAIYRFDIRHPESGDARYVGETVNLEERLKGYRKPGPSQDTNLRLNAELLKGLACGADVTLSAVLADAWLEVAGGRLPANLRSKSVRLLLENAAILSAPAAVEVLNLAD